MQLFQNAHYDFIRWRWHAISLSLVVIIGGLAAMALRGGLPLGVDFSGGTIVVVQFEDAVSVDDVRAAVAPVEGEEIVQQYGLVSANEWLIRLPQIEADEAGALLEQGSLQIVEALTEAGLPAFEVISTDIVGPVMGAQLQRQGIYATVLAMLGITLYITFRFRFTFAAGALVAVVHDVLVTLSMLTVFNYELSLNVVAAILLITGYSVNDTIVVFDRVRENMRSLRREPLSTIINMSVNQTLARTVITSGTTFVAVLSLFLFGGEVLKSFAFTVLVGVISGTYSTVFIAAAVAIIMSQRAQSKRATTPHVEGGRRARRAKAS